jgi:hypothetical protein
MHVLLPVEPESRREAGEPGAHDDDVLDGLLWLHPSKELAAWSEPARQHKRL